MDLQESVDQALALLPGDGAKVPYSVFREQVITALGVNAEPALLWILKNKRAAREMGRDEQTNKLVALIGRRA